MRRLFIALTMPLLLGVACHKTTKEVRSATNSKTVETVKTTPDTNAESSGQVSQTPILPAPSTNTENNSSPKRDSFTPIYFSFDESGLNLDAMVQLDEIGAYLEAHPDEGIIISGHTDERGSEEYNMALSDQRALSAKDYLTRLRIDPARIAIIPYGEELPSLIGSNEDSWSKNRRDEFKIVQKSASK